MSYFLFYFSQGFIIVCSLCLLFMSVSKIVTLRHTKNISKAEYKYFKEGIQRMNKFINSINEQSIEKEVSTIATPPNQRGDYNDNSLHYPLITTSLETTGTGFQGYSFSSSITAYSFNHKTKEMLGITDDLDNSTIESSDILSENNADVICEDIYRAENKGIQNCLKPGPVLEQKTVSSPSGDLIYRLYEYRLLVRSAERKIKTLFKATNYYYQMILYCVFLMSIYSLFIGLFYKCSYISMNIFYSCSRLVYVVMTDLQYCIILMMNTMFIYVSTLTLSNITKVAKSCIRVFFIAFVIASVVATPISYLVTDVSCMQIDIRRDIVQSSVILVISTINLITFSFSIKLAMGKVGYILFYSFHILLETVGIKKKKSVSGRRKTDLEDKYQAKRRLKNNLSILLIVGILMIILGLYHLTRSILELESHDNTLIDLACSNMVFKFRYIIQDLLKFTILFWYIGLVNSYVNTEYKNKKNLYIDMCKIFKIIEKEAPN